MKIIVTNTVMLNGGDAAILMSIVKGLKKTFGPNTQIVVYGDKAAVASKYYPELEFKEQLQTYLSALNKGSATLAKVHRTLKNRHFDVILNLLEAGQVEMACTLMPPEVKEIFDDYASADLIVSTGGTYLVENYKIRGKYTDLSLALGTGKPVVLFTQSMGPFNDEDNRAMLQKVFPRCALILLRDEASLDYCRQVNTAENMHVSSDVVFDATTQDLLLFAATRSSLKPERVAISVRYWPYFKNEDTETGMKRYLDAVRHATEHFIDVYGSQVTFLSTCQGISEYWVDDSKIAMQIYESLSPKYQSKVVVDTEFHHPFELQALYANFDVVLATRLHAAILSLTAGTPVIPISYEFKTNEVFARFGLEDYVLDIDTVTAESLVGKVDAYIQNYSTLGKQLFDGVLREHINASRSFVETLKVTPEGFVKLPESAHLYGSQIY